MMKDFVNKEIDRVSSVREIYTILFRQKRKFLLFFFIVFSLVALYTFLATPQYKSEAKIMVKVGRESVTLDPTASQGQTLSISQSREEEINSEVDIMNSREIANRVVNEIGIDNFFNDIDKNVPKDILQESAISTVMRSIDINVPRRSNVITLTYTADNSIKAQNILSTMIKAYLYMRQEIHFTPGSYEFFTQQTGDLRLELQEAEKRLVDLKTESGVASLENNRSMILDRIGRLQQQIDENNSELVASRTRVQELEKIVNDLPDMTVTQQMSGNEYMNTELYNLKLREQDLLSRYKENNVRVKEIRREIAKADSILKADNQVQKGTNSTYQDLNRQLLEAKSMLSSYQSRDRELKASMAEAQADMDELLQYEAKIKEIELETEMIRESYRNYMDNLETARFDEALKKQNLSNISIVQEATFPIKPDSPKKAMNLAFGLLVAVFGGIALALLSEYVDHSIRSSEDIERELNLYTLATVPYFEGGMPENGDADKYFESVYNQLIPDMNNVAQMSKTVCVLSCYDGEGVSTVSANLAKKIAAAHQKVLLVDINHMQPSIHHTFNTELSPGLIDLLNNSQKASDVIKNTNYKNLYVLTAGTPVHEKVETEDQTVELSTNALMKQDNDQEDAKTLMETKQSANTFFIDKLKKYFNFIIFDAPAVQSSLSVLRIASVVDDVIFVVESERTRWEAAMENVERLHNVGANIRGAILNKKRYYIPKWLYNTL